MSWFFALAWGYNPGGRLGHGDISDSAVPVPVRLPAGTRVTPSRIPVGVRLPEGSTVTAIGAGGDHSLAVTATGTVLAWGANTGGQLGNGTTISHDVPVPAAMHLPS